MKRKSILTGLAVFVTFGFLRSSLPAQTADESLRNEVQAAIDKGLRYLKSKQDPATGAIGSTDSRAFTALGVMALMGDPRIKDQPMPEAAKKGYDFLLASQKPDGGIYTTGLPNYNTSLALTALTMAGSDTKFRDAILKARRLVIGGQYDDGEKGKQDTPYDGGGGYGSKTM